MRKDPSIFLVFVEDVGGRRDVLGGVARCDDQRAVAHDADPCPETLMGNCILGSELCLLLPDIDVSLEDVS
eukprot:Skav221630  [mRNA]  locus=scaffold2627:102014:109968:- [translate_table: standard]